MEPAVGSSRPAMVRRSVVLPAPVGPRTTSSSSCPRSRSMPSSAFVDPNFLTTPRSVKNASGMFVAAVMAGSLVEDVQRIEVQREANGRTDRVARLGPHHDAAERRLDVNVAMRSEVLVENHFAGNRSLVVGAHVLRTNSERGLSGGGHRCREGDRDIGPFGDENGDVAPQLDRTLDEVHARTTHEVRDEEIAWAFVDVGGRPDLSDFA